MSQQFNSVTAYPAFRLRFRALLFDWGICATAFLIWGIAAGVVFEQHPLARSAAFIVIVLAIVSYEPFMVSRYGRTFGHRAFNIYVVAAKTQENLSLQLAVVEPSSSSFWACSRLHSCLSQKGLRVCMIWSWDPKIKIRNTQRASAADYFVPPQLPAGRLLPSATRRIVVIVIYNVVLFFFVGSAELIAVSQR